MDKNAIRRKNDFIKKSKLKYKYNDYSNIEFTNAKEIVKNIHCTKHQIHFDINIASNHYNKEHNCKLCLDKEIDEDEVDIVFKNLFIERASQIYPNNDYSKIKYYGSKKNVENIICKLHGSFNIRATCHINDHQNCKNCPSYKYKSNDEINRTIVYLNKTDILNGLNNKKSNNLTFKHLNECIECNVSGYTNYGPSNTINPTVCNKCSVKYPNYINILSKKCIVNDCILQSVSGDKNEKVRIMCLNHGNLFGFKNIQDVKIEIENNKIIEDAKANEIPLTEITLKKKSGDCKYGNCKSRAMYNEYGVKGVLYCSDHGEQLLKKSTHSSKNPKMKCVEKECDEWANYAIDRNKKSKVQYCYNHRKENFYNIFNDYCMLCNTAAGFGIIKDGKYKNLWCNSCSIKLKKDEPELQIITKPSCNRNKKCSIQNCKSTGTYINDNDERVCINHYDKNTCKKDNNELKRECVVEGCTARGVIETKNGYKYCNSCSKSIDQDEIKVKIKKNNVKTFHETDNIENLLKVALYKKTIEQINNLYRCIIDGCTTIPSYGYKDDRMPQYCKLHAKSGMDISSRGTLCKSCNEIYTRDEKCFRCTNPNTQIRKKESMIVDELKKIYPNLTNNKEIIGGSSKYRPDIFISLDNHNIIIEIDENQHSKYENELSRLEDLSNDLNDDKYQIFIRFNPDKYDKKNKSILDDENEFKERMQILLESIEILTSKNETRVVYLFYDKF